MGISVGGIDITDSIINIEYQLNRTQKILDWILANNKKVLNLPSKDIMTKIDENAIADLQKKYPQAGIHKK
ncbi:MAG: hypothetical protein U5N56_04745 [Candidatus Marinimicrobia bacterium]|nr:hypothetical protein [Candidatus Neomarinimicrobiota bacterium]